MLGALFYAVQFAVLLSSVLGFGVTTSGNLLVVDTSAGLVFKVDKTTGDITSMVFNGIEAQDQSGKHSQISSGIGASCSAVQTGNNNNYILITCTTSTLTHYYVGRYKDPAVHMATYVTAEPTVGELRYIARLNRATIPNGYIVSDIEGGTAIEGSDVYTVNGQTRSKFYSSRQFIDDQVHGVSGNGIGVYMIIPGNGYESSSGGPFFRDIDNQGGDQQELYFYMNSGHTQTESYRTGLFGPYALWFTTGSAPAASSVDPSFWEGLGIKGLVPQSGRGRVTGKASGIASNFATLQSVGFANSAAQYWVRTDSSGSFTTPYMKPGTYTMTLYKVELAVATQSVVVSSGGTITSNIASQEANPTSIWQIGDFDGTPRGFLNADKIETMHPSDSRMSSWGPVSFTVGQSISSFPMATFKAVGAVTIRFTLSSSQIGARTLQIGTTNAFAGGRPSVVVNSWSSTNPAAPSQPDSRGVTRGTWRGNVSWFFDSAIAEIFKAYSYVINSKNIMYTFNIPSGTLVSGSNTITINVISGSSGDAFLSPNFIFDAVRLY